MVLLLVIAFGLALISTGVAIYHRDPEFVLVSAALACFFLAQAMAASGSHV